MSVSPLGYDKIFVVGSNATELSRFLDYNAEILIFQLQISLFLDTSASLGLGASAIGHF